MKRILIVYDQFQSFVKNDVSILSKDFEVSQYHFVLKKGLFGFIWNQLRAIFYLLSKGRKADVFYIWFCDYHAFTSVVISRLLRKKTIIVVGGFDAVSVPSIQYGLFLKNNMRAKMARWAYRNCNRIITVDPSLIRSNNTFAGPDSITGVLNHVSIPESKISSIPTGYDIDKWKCSHDKESTVLTIALVKDQKVFLRKGVDFFLEVAERMPEYRFVIVGIRNEELIDARYASLSNIEFYPILPQEELLEYYSKSKVYAQFSVSEGLPNVLCEAMLCECIPVGSSANGIPLAIGETGFIVSEKTPEIACQYIREAMESDNTRGKMARERISKLFPDKRRREELKHLIEQL